QVVTKRYPGSRGRDNHNILPGMDGFRCGGLMRIQAAYPFRGVGGDQFRPHPPWKIRPLRFARRKMPHCGKDFAVAVTRSERIQHFVNACETVCCPSNRQRHDAQLLKDWERPAMLSPFVRHPTMRLLTAQEEIRNACRDGG